MAKMKLNDSLEKREYDFKKKPKDIIFGPADKSSIPKETISSPKKVR
jgi:hypothetical protein